MSPLLSRMARAVRGGGWGWRAERAPLSPQPPLSQAKEGELPVLLDYFEGIKDAPVPARLMAEAPPQASARKALQGLAWALAGAALVAAAATFPPPVDRAAAARAAAALAGARR